MPDELILYTNPMSRGRIARWMLEETGAPYRTEVLEYGTTMKGPAYLAVNPMGKVPAIRHGDVVVTEAAAICAYLADALPGAGLAPPPGERGPYYRWLFFAAGPVEAAVSNRFLGFEVPGDMEAMIGYGTFAAVMDALEGAVSGGGYVAGDRFTAADVYVGSHIGWGLRMQSNREARRLRGLLGAPRRSRRLAEGHRAGRRPPGRAQPAGIARVHANRPRNAPDSNDVRRSGQVGLAKRNPTSCARGGPWPASVGLRFANRPTALRLYGSSRPSWMRCDGVNTAQWVRR